MLKALINKALEARKINDHHLALQLFQKAYLDYPFNPNLPIQIAIELTSLSRYKEALNFLQRAKNADPMRVLNQKGLIALAQNKKKMLSIILKMASPLNLMK